MARLFLRSLKRYLALWARSFRAGSGGGAALNPRRLRFLLVLMPLVVLLQCIHWGALLLDEILFPGYRAVAIRKPVFISGIPRSGTTFLHRILARQTGFTSLSTWEALLAPSILERRALRLLTAVDRRLGAPLRRSVEAVLRRSAGDFDAVHEIDPTAPEEDYLALLPCAGCFMLLLAFPFDGELEALGSVDRLPERFRDDLLDFYERILQRHLHESGDSPQLLSKNAAFASWIPLLLERFPDAHAILCIREPLGALSSQLSAIHGARTAFGTDPEGTMTRETFIRLFERNYHQIALLSAEAGRVSIIDQADMAADPAGIVRALLPRLGIKPSSRLSAAIAALRPRGKSAHHHSADAQAIDPAVVESRIRPQYDLILRSPARMLPATKP